MAKIVSKRIKKKKNPFVYKPKSDSPKHQWLKQRHSKEDRFKLFGILAVSLSILFMISLFFGIISGGASAFVKTELNISVKLLAASDGDRSAYRNLIRKSLLKEFPDISGRRQKLELYNLLSNGAIEKLSQYAQDNPELADKEVKVWLPASDIVDMYVKGMIAMELDESLRKISDMQVTAVEKMTANNNVRKVFNFDFFTHGDSRNPEEAGIFTALVGSLFTMLVALMVAFPLGVASAIYLEEFASRNWFTTLIEININNLAAVPSIIFGLLGLSIYLNYFGMPRSSSLVGGMTLALLVLPVIIIAARNALSCVPDTVRYAAFALGASKVQVVFHHILPYSMPGIMTGVILAVARAFGETAPLLMIGMMAFIVDSPSGVTDPSTSLPIQIYLWADSPEAAFAEKTSAAILVLLVILIFINLFATYLRKRFAVKW